MIDKNSLTYRQSTIAAVINKNNKILVVQKEGWHDNEWAFPGGGVEENETPEQAVSRELREELGTDKLELVVKSLVMSQYDWPDEVIERKVKEGLHWRGQQVSQFLFKFLGNDNELIFPPEEIIRGLWVNISDLHQYLIFPNQFENVEKLLKEFKLANV